MLRITLLLSIALLASSPAAAETTELDPMVLVDMDGNPHEIDKVLDSGRRVVLVFWQTWCGPCKREAPGLALAAHEHAKGLEFIGVIAGADRDVDDEKVRAYVEKYKLPYTQIRDRDLSLVKTYEVVGTPTIIVLGDEREVLFRSNHPPEDWNEFDLGAKNE